MLSHGGNLATAGRSPEHRHVDAAHRNGTRLPTQLVGPALAAIDDLIGTLGVVGTLGGAAGPLGGAASTLGGAVGLKLRRAS